MTATVESVETVRWMSFTSPVLRQTAYYSHCNLPVCPSRVSRTINSIHFSLRWFIAEEPRKRRVERDTDWMRNVKDLRRKHLVDLDLSNRAAMQTNNNNNNIQQPIRRRYLRDKHSSEWHLINFQLKGWSVANQLTAEEQGGAQDRRTSADRITKTEAVKPETRGSSCLNL